MASRPVEPSALCAGAWIVYKVEEGFRPRHRDRRREGFRLPVGASARRAASAVSRASSNIMPATSGGGNEDGGIGAEHWGTVIGYCRADREDNEGE